MFKKPHDTYHNLDFESALKTLREGGTILYPTDTIWGIGCDACQANAVQKVYAIKARDPRKSMLVLVDSPGMLSRYVREIPDMAYQMIDIADKPITIIYPDAIGLPENLIAADGSIAIRVVQDEFCRKLIQFLRKPIVSTSANFSGKPAPASFAEIDENIKMKVDYIVKFRQEEKRKFSPSPIIRMALNGEIKVIRS